jgi:ribosome biogenesis GTPase A
VAAASGVLSGHMARGERALREALGAVDLVWEVADARAPRASRNPGLRRLCAGKARLIVLAKADLAEEDATAAWRAALCAEAETVALDLRAEAADLGGLWRAAEAALRRAGARAPAAGYRALVAGMPNTGKSTLLNRIMGRRRAAVGARPGVTRGPQWFSLPAGGHLLDLPGVLAPRLGAWPVAWRLWAVGAVGPAALDAERAGAALAERVAARQPRALQGRYGVDERCFAGAASGAEGEGGGLAALAAIACQRGLLGAGGIPDLSRAAAVLLGDYRRGLLGAVTLDDPPRAG